MHVTLRLPAAAARELNLAVNDAQEEVTVTLTPTELAGRLTVSTGQVITPESVVQYCGAWSAARAACSALADRYGWASLITNLRECCSERLLWLPEDDHDIVTWLHLVFEASMLRSQYGATLTPVKAYAWAYQLDGERVAGLCEALFPVVYGLWAAVRETGLVELRGPQIRGNVNPDV